MSDSLRTRLNLLIATLVAFAFGLGLASALSLTPVSIAAENTDAGWVVGVPGAADPTMANGFAAVAERVAPAVVTLYVTGERQVLPTSPFPFPPGFQPEPEGEEEAGPRTRRESWSGSGFIVSNDGYVVTNNHVVADGEQIDVELQDGRRFYDVDVVGRDPQTDVALIRLDADDLTVLPIGSSDDTAVGEWVLAIGSPGFRPSRRPLLTTVTAGIVSAKGRNIDILRSIRNQLAIEDFIQTDAVINRGNSGGPLVNAAGEVIGINTAIVSSTGSYEGYGFAVPIELAREVVDDLIEFGEVRRALIGVSIADVSAADAAYYGLERVEGALIKSFSFDGSPAREAGLSEGDVIVGVAGEPVAGVSELQRRIRGFEPGETVTLDVVRRATLEPDRARVRLSSAEGDASPQLARRRTPAPETGDGLGLDVREPGTLSRDERREYGVEPGDEGVVIVDGDPRGAIGRGFGAVPTGAIILDINGDEIRDRAAYNRIVSELRPGDALSVRVSLLLRSGRQEDIRSLVIPDR